MKDSFWKILTDYSLTIGISIVIALLIRTYLIESYKIPSSSMQPTLLAGDLIFVKKWPKLQKNYTPRRGDVIIFSKPAQGHDGSYFFNAIKRVVGIGGDVIVLRSGQVILNGHPLFDRESAQAQTSENVQERFPGGPTYAVKLDVPAMDDYGPITVPHQSVFVLSDRRSKNVHQTHKINASVHSAWNLIPISSIQGQALWIWLSIRPADAAETMQRPYSFPSLRWDRMFTGVD